MRSFFKENEVTAASKTAFEYYKKQAATYWLKAVSYTHLRAHETVLDLVCRLLLEKKTKKDSTHTLVTTPIASCHNGVPKET